MIFISAYIIIVSRGPALYWSDRVGRDNKQFKMPKFRTMKLNTPQVATHLLKGVEDFYIPYGNFLRKLSIDELPQLYSIIKGDMGLVGPRPALFNQDDLMALRIENRIDHLLPGVTGWAQVNGRDELSLKMKVGYEVEYLNRKTFLFDLYIIWLTVLKVIKKDGISH